MNGMRLEGVGAFLPPSYYKAEREKKAKKAKEGKNGKVEKVPEKQEVQEENPFLQRVASNTNRTNGPALERSRSATGLYSPNDSNYSPTLVDRNLSYDNPNYHFPTRTPSQRSQNSVNGPRRKSLHQYQTYSKTDSAISLSLENQSLFVESCELSPEDEWIYTIEVKLVTKQSNILFRTYEDFWTLHEELLDLNPRESGKAGTPRALPFMDPPVGHMSSDEAIRRRKFLNFYLQELNQLGNKLNLRPLQYFLILRDMDMKIENTMFANASETIMDLLSDLTVRKDVPVKLTHNGRTMNWRENDSVSVSRLFRHATECFGEPLLGLLYRNEWGEKVSLTNNNELRMLIKFRERLVLFSAN